MRESSKPVIDPGSWTDDETALLEAAVRIQGKVERIPCLASIGLGKPCDEVPHLICISL
jgi:hypothetical protein